MGLFYFLFVLASWGQVSDVQFVDVTEEAGIHFQHAGGFEKRVIPAIVGSGAAFVDYDNDGDLDLYIVNSTVVSPRSLIGGEHSGVEQTDDAGAGLPRNALYRNNGDGTFTDVTEAAGVGDTGWGMGCAFADYDNDGDADLYVTNYKANVFHKNNGDGTFVKFSAGAGGLGHTGFGAGVAWADYDNDGYVDLYFANYLDYSKVPQGKEVFFPYDFFGEENVLLLNKGDGKFINMTDSAGVGGGFHLSLGVAFADYDNDGDADLYIANDTDQNILYRNNGDGTFTNTNLPDARSHTGDIRGGMGIAWGDYDNDGDLDLFVTNWLDENNVLYRNNGDGTFTDVSAQSGVFESGIGKTCWGTEFFD
ncbi:VCBS repeat-containing protein, partial [Candidatus Poribacteria bacterium]|nr:VCBS repeat-containing protein [Candidatus Poribacteria bacterium]